MSATLLEGVVIAILLVVAWQIGVRLAPIILNRVKRTVDPGKDSHPQPDQTTPQKLLTDKEHPYDQP